eukprot:gene26710-53985_t
MAQEVPQEVATPLDPAGQELGQVKGGTPTGVEGTTCPLDPAAADVKVEKVVVVQPEVAGGDEGTEG